MPRTAKYQIDRSRSTKSKRKSWTLRSNAEEDDDVDHVIHEAAEGSDEGSADHPSNGKRQPQKERLSPELSEVEESNEKAMRELESEDDEPTPSSRKSRSNRRKVAIQDDDDDEYVVSSAVSNSSYSVFDDVDDKKVVDVERSGRSSLQSRRSAEMPGPTRRSSRRGKNSKDVLAEELSDCEKEEEGPPQSETSSRSRRTLQPRKAKRPYSAPTRTRPTRLTRKAQSKQNVSDRRSASSPIVQESLAVLPSPKRPSAMKARNKMISVVKLEDLGSDQDITSDSQNDSDSEYIKKPVAKKNLSTTSAKKLVDSSDEEFRLNSGSESCSAGDSSFSDSMEDDDEKMVTETGRNCLGGNVHEKEGCDDEKDVTIDNEEVGTADESDDNDEDVMASPNKRKEILPSPRKGTFWNSDLSSDEEMEKREEHAKDSQSPRCSPCPSEVDAITGDDLQSRHICYVSPDGKSRQCFELETLRQIALQSANLQLRLDLDGKHRRNFLQPPHFRTAASDDLLDQIASKFGRDALDLHGAFYDRKRKSDRTENEDIDGSGGAANDGVYSLRFFKDRVKSYFDRSMGSQDVYTCPLCYSQIHKTMMDPDADCIREQAAVPEDVYDPMHVLGNVDNDSFQVASLFCFTRASEVKRHIRMEHKVDTRAVQGNDLYMRYKVRAPDGLLQRYLARTIYGARQGSMRIYWNDGNNQSFIHLLDLIKQARIYEAVISDPDAPGAKKEEAGDYLNKALPFYNAFASEAAALWDSLSAPFNNATDNMNDFIAYDDEIEEEVEDEAVVHASLHRKLAAEDDESDENDLIHKLRRKYADEGESDEGESDDELEIVNSPDFINEDEDDGEEEDLEKLKGYYSPVEEETDDWVLSRQKKKKATLSSAVKQSENISKKRVATSSAKMNSFGKKMRPKPGASLAMETPNAKIQLEVPKRTPVLQDSDDEDWL